MAALSSLLSNLQLPPTPAPPITALLSSLSDLIGSCPDSSLQSVASKLEHLFNTADRDWLLSAEEAEYLSVSRALIGRCAPPVSEDECAFEQGEYEGVWPKAEAVSRALGALLRTVGQTHRSGSGPEEEEREEEERKEEEKREEEEEEREDEEGPEEEQRAERILMTVAPDVCVFAVTHFQVAPWSSPSSRSAAQEVMRALLEAGQWTDSAHMLMGGGGAKGILGGVLDLLQPQLHKSPSEAVRLVFSWCLLLLTSPSLGGVLDRVLAPSLLLSDHYRPETCVLGVSCVHHIVKNTTGADLRQWNRAQVLHQTMFRLLYNNHPLTIQGALSCLMDLLLVLERPPSLCGATPVTHHDAVLRLVLTQMEAEHKVCLRRVYASALPALVTRFGAAVCRHLSRLHRVMEQYLLTPDPPELTCTIHTLHTLNQTLRTAWPRYNSRRLQGLLAAVLRLVVDVSADCLVSDSVKRQVFSLASEALRLMDMCTQGTVQCLLLQVNDSHCSPEVLRVLTSATDPTHTGTKPEPNQNQTRTEPNLDPTQGHRQNFTITSDLA